MVEKNSNQSINILYALGSEELCSLLEDISEYYSLGEIKNYKTILGHSGDLVVVIITSRGKYVVKASLVPLDSNRVILENQILELLSEQGLSVQKLLCNNDKLPYATFHLSNREVCVKVFEYLPGEPMSSVEITMGDIADVTNLMVLFHKISKNSLDFQYDSQSKQIRFFKNIDAKFSRKSIDFLLEVDSEVASEIDSFYEHRLQGLITEYNVLYRHRLIVHADLAPGNILKDAQGFSLIDFNDLGYISREWDIASFICSWYRKQELLDLKTFFDFIMSTYTASSSSGSINISLIKVMMRLYFFHLIYSGIWKREFTGVWDDYSRYVVSSGRYCLLESEYV